MSSHSRITPRYAKARVRRSPMKFVGLLLLLSLPFWLLGILAPSSLLPFGLPISALMAVCPMLAALILTWRHEGWPTAKELFRRAFDVGRIRDKRWLLLSVLVMPVVMLCSWCLMQHLDYPLPTPSITVLTIPLMLLFYFVGAIGEELGWMGYLVDRLQERMNALSAALMVGVVWQAWHIVPLYAMGRSVAWISAHFLAGILIRIIMVWLYNRAGKSVFTAIVFHTSLNVTFTLFPNQGSHYDPVVTALVLAVIVVAAGVLTQTRRSLQSRESS